MNLETLLALGLSIGLAFGSHDVHALRCSGKIIDEDSSAQEVVELCKGGDVYQVKNTNTDVMKYTYKNGGMNHKITIVDGEVQSIESER